VQIFKRKYKLYFRNDVSRIIVRIKHFLG